MDTGNLGITESGGPADLGMLRELVFTPVQRADPQNRHLFLASAQGRLRQNVDAERRVATKQIGVLDERGEHVVKRISFGERAERRAYLVIPRRAWNHGDPGSHRILTVTSKPPTLSQNVIAVLAQPRSDTGP